MEIEIQKENGQVILSLSGRLDTNTSGEFENALIELFNKGEKNILIDLKDLIYLSSAGLRVFLGAQKTIDSINGKMLVKNVNETIMEIFQITGFLEFIKIV
ncbi:MAG: putative anti-sigma factor antagonist BtrV [Eubacteriales bacterium SKADARSKE-1]|nr:putative anti-sigma factor antagonist BtrV [Eubacteriales bacterium SKADARSKE-1]